MLEYSLTEISTHTHTKFFASDVIGIYVAEAITGVGLNIQ